MKSSPWNCITNITHMHMKTSMHIHDSIPVTITHVKENRKQRKKGHGVYKHTYAYIGSWHNFCRKKYFKITIYQLWLLLFVIVPWRSLQGTLVTLSSWALIYFTILWSFNYCSNKNHWPYYLIWSQKWKCTY
jgi:hypothetical protein